jgi:hypothetical protein
LPNKQSRRILLESFNQASERRRDRLNRKPSQMLHLLTFCAVAWCTLAHATWAQLGLETHTPFPQPVLNAPYTAQRVTTTYQKLADGTQITHERIDLVARDSLGRTWSQVEVQNKGPLRRDGKKFSAWIVWDPLTLTMADWCDCNHVAWLKHFDPPSPTRDNSAASVAQGRPQGVTVYIGPVTDRMRYVLEPLPAQDLMGVRTEGSKAVRTVPAGKDGNDRDLTWTVQSWYSPDLKLALFTIVDDPVKGTAKYEFRDLKRIEPDPSIFRIPAGYAIKDSVPLNRAPLTDESYRL